MVGLVAEQLQQKRVSVFSLVKWIGDYGQLPTWMSLFGGGNPANLRPLPFLSLYQMIEQ